MITCVGVLDTSVEDRTVATVTVETDSELNIRYPELVCICRLN